MSNQKPFYSPLLYPHLNQQQPQAPPEPQPQAQFHPSVAQPPPMILPYDPAPPCGPNFVTCDYCNSKMTVGEDGAEILLGKIGRSPKSGTTLVVPEPSLYDLGNPNPYLHWDCMIQWIEENLFGVELMPSLCDACQREIYDDES